MLTIDTCPEGFDEILGKCYKFVDYEYLKWQDAQIACQEIPGNYDLVVVDNEELWNELKQYNDYWIGLHDMFSEGVIQWVNGQTLEFGKTLGSAPWANGEPNVSYVI